MNKLLTTILICLFPLLIPTTALAQYGPALNKDGSYVTGVLTASFDPRGSFGVAKSPFPTSLLYNGTTDLTLNVPAADPTNFGDPAVALGTQDGFSTTEKWTTSFANGTPGNYDNAIPGQIDRASVVAGQSVRVFEVTTSGFVGVTSIVKELTPWVDYAAAALTDSVVGIIPLRPLKEYTSYMAVLTNDIKDINGNDATPDRLYGLGKTSVPWVDANGNSTYALFTNEQAAGFETIRQITQSMELNAASVGIDPADIILSWTVQTQSITPTLKLLTSIAQPMPTTIGPAVATSANLGGLGLANVHIGIITVPYYAGVPTPENLTAAVTEFWKAAPGAYVPPYDQFGLDPTSTNITFANPMPVTTSMQTVPLLITVPNANSGHSKPDTGWPVVIFGHGITRSRMDAIGIADTMASLGYAVVAMDFPLHGISPDATPALAPFYIKDTPFGPFANERTFDMDLLNNVTGAPGPDGLIDPSGSHAVSAGLSSMLTGRDTIRQGIADLSVLAVTIPTIDLDGDGSADTNGSNIAYVGQSWGGIHGTVLSALQPAVTRSVLSVPGGGIARMAEGSASFGPTIRAGLAAAGVLPGTAAFEQFLTLWQTMLDSADPINWAAAASANTPIMLHEVINDQVIPNYVATAPLSGTEPLIAVMDLTPYSSSQQSPDGLRSAGRFLPPAVHGSLLDPGPSPAAFAEMQGQMASFVDSFGGGIVVTNSDTMVQIIEVQPSASSDLQENGNSKLKINRQRNNVVQRPKDSIMPMRPSYYE